MGISLLLLSLVALLVVPVGDVEIEVDVILEVVVGLRAVSLANSLVEAVVIILWITFGTYKANHLGLSTKFLPKRIIQPHLDHLLVWVQL
jgi:hypothetical protein